MAQRIREADERRAYRCGHLLVYMLAQWACFAGLLGIVTALGFQFGDPSALQELLPGWVEGIWSLTYLTGGVLMVYGIRRLVLRVEAAGAVMIAGVQFVNVYAIAVQRGLSAVLVSGVGLAIAIGLLRRAQWLAASARKRQDHARGIHHA